MRATREYHEVKAYLKCSKSVGNTGMHVCVQVEGRVINAQMDGCGACHLHICIFANMHIKKVARAHKIH